MEKGHVNTVGAKEYKSQWLTMEEIYTVRTVEDFWAVYNNILAPAELPHLKNYYFFREGLEPAWEDEKNAAGGTWEIKSPPSDKGPKLNDYWLNTLMLVVGSQFDGDDNDAICGAVLATRKRADKLQLWTAYSDAAHEASVLRIGAKFKATLGHPGKVGFTSHADAQIASKATSFRSDSKWEV